MKVGGVAVAVVRKAIKNLHLGVYPPHGRVRVAAPREMSDDAIRLAVVSKLGWIKRQRTRFEAQPRQSVREMVNGESHYVLGRRFRLRVVDHDGVERVTLRGKTVLELCVRPKSTAEHREHVLHLWYRRQLRDLIPPLVEKWAAELGIEAPALGVKKMKTKWGSCSRAARRIWLNTELAKKPHRCLEYIVLHELVHLIERNHQAGFTALMDKHMPMWRHVRVELNRGPLAHESWGY
jgi:hypothetical protein